MKGNRIDTTVSSRCCGEDSKLRDSGAMLCSASKQNSRAFAETCVCATGHA